MRIKKTLIAILGCAVLCSYGIPAFAAEKEASVTSNFHTSQVRIQVNQYDEAGQDWTDPKAILPGSPVPMISEIQNLGTDCYVRVKLTTETETGKEIPFTCFQGISEDWKQAGEYLYYTKILEPKASAEIFQAFELPADWNQEGIAKDTIQIHLQVDAIQSDHFTPDFTSESPWGNVEVQEAVEPEEGYQFRVLEAGEGYCTVRVEGDKIITVPDHFFSELGNMVPGDTLQGTIDIQNVNDYEEELYLKIQPESEEQLLQQANLRIVSGDGTIFYDGALISDVLNQFHYLNTYGSGEEGALHFEISLPEELDNAYSLKDAKMTWTLKAVHEEAIQQVESSDPGPAVRADVPKTGEASHHIIIGLTIAAGCCVVGMIIYKVRQMRKRI